MRTTRRAFLKRTGLTAAVSATGAGAAARAPKTPSFLLIVSDDQGAQMGCLGTAGLSTPHMDTLARRGALFRRAFCTFGSCSPARASMLTGLMPHAHGVARNVFEHFGPEPPADWPAGRRRLNAAVRVRDEVPTLIELLRRAGYRTGITSKFHLSPHRKFPFDAWIKGNDGPDVAAFIAGCKGRPFFLMHNIRSPHRPFLPFIRRAGREIIDPKRVKVPAYLPDTPLMRRDWAEYLTAVEVTDVRLGAALAALGRSGRAQETIVLCTGDNGPAFHRGKYSVYDFALRVPLISAGPGVTAGRETTELAGHVDLMATMADYAGIALSAPTHGLSLRPILADRTGARGHDVIFGQVRFGPGAQAAQARSASDGRLHYIRRINREQPHAMPADNFQARPWGNHSYQATLDARRTHPATYRLLKQVEGTPPAEELFDLSKDPWCTRSVLSDPAYAAGLARLRKALEHQTRRTGDRAFAGQPAQKGE